MNKTPEEIIDSLRVNKANLDYIASTGKINGSLFVDFKRCLEEYGRQQYNQAIKDAAENPTIKVVEYSKHGGKIVYSCDLGEEISADMGQQYYQVNKDSILKLLKP